MTARRNGRPLGSRDRAGRAVRAVPRSEPYTLYMQLVGERIRELREEQDIAASELAAALGVHPQTVLNWENNNSPHRRYPSIANLYRIAMALGVRVSDVVEVES